MDHKRKPPKWIACWYENGVRSDQLEDGLRTDLNIVFWNILISYSRSRAETVFFHTNFSRRILWCAWEPVQTPHLKKFVNSENAEGPKKQPCKNGGQTLNLVWNGFRKFNLGHGDLDPAPNFDPDALAMVPGPENLVFDPKISKMSKNLKRNWIACLF